MGDEKVVKPKQTGMALVSDVMKKIAHQLGRLPPGSGPSVMLFMADWAGRNQIAPGPPVEKNGQLPLAAKDMGFPE